MVNEEREMRGRKASTTEGEGSTAAGQSSQMAPPANAPVESKAKKKPKFPCGKCGEEAKGQTICCQICEVWFHFECVPGMTKEYFENCKPIYKTNLINLFSDELLNNESESHFHQK